MADRAPASVRRRRSSPSLSRTRRELARLFHRTRADDRARLRLATRRARRHARQTSALRAIAVLRKNSRVENTCAPTQEPDSIHVLTHKNRFVWPANVHGGRSCADVRADFLTTLEQIDN